MKIIVEGDLTRLKHTKRFVCLYCYCVFYADQGEYKEDQRDGAYCECPCCGHNAGERQ